MSTQEDKYCKVGDLIPEPRPPVFELDIDAHVQAVGPINPRNYFVTSGDAVSKASVLAADLHSYATTTGDDQARQASDRAAELVRSLIAVRGDAVFLETEYDINHRLLCIPKNPRSRADV